MKKKYQYKQVERCNVSRFLNITLKTQRIFHYNYIADWIKKNIKLIFLLFKFIYQIISNFFFHLTYIYLNILNIFVIACNFNFDFICFSDIQHYLPKFHGYRIYRWNLFILRRLISNKRFYNQQDLDKNRKLIYILPLFISNYQKRRNILSTFTSK